MTIQVMASLPTRTDGQSMLEAIHRFSGTTMIGRTITLARDITRRLAVVIRAVLAADTSEASAAGTVAVVTAAGIAERGC
jgi:hypothetical protein